MQVDHSDKDCYGCGEKGHIAANCPKKGASLKGGGKGDFKGGKGGKAGKGGGKAGASPGKGNGAKGGWPPSLQNWKQWYPGPSPAQWTGWWRQNQTNQYKGTANLFEQGNRLSQLQQPQQQGWEQAGWQDGGAWPSPSTQTALQSLFMGGSMYKLVEKGPKPKQINCDAKPVESPNKFQALQMKGDETVASEAEASDEKDRITTSVPIARLIKPESRNRQRKKARAASQTSNGDNKGDGECSHEGFLWRRACSRAPMKLVMPAPPLCERCLPTSNGVESCWAFSASASLLDFVRQTPILFFRFESSNRGIVLS